MGSTPWLEQSYVELNPDHAAQHISWNDVQELIQRLNEDAGEEIYRLPTEAEWEYSCRAGTTTRWSFGDDEAQLGEYAWYVENAWDVGLWYTQPVGVKLPNPWGLYDMYGSVWELCQDWHGPYAAHSEVDPTGPAIGTRRVNRGGGLAVVADRARSASRSSIRLPSFRAYDVGARLLRAE